MDSDHEDWRQQGMSLFNSCQVSLSSCHHVILVTIYYKHRYYYYPDNNNWIHEQSDDLSKSLSFFLPQDTFHYDSGFWSDKNEYNLRGGETGFDTQETKLPTYWNTSFTKICLGMKIGQQINFLFFYKTADSLYSLIADGQHRATSLGRAKWKMLIGSQASLQYNCNKEGFNAFTDDDHFSRARIGILAENQQNACKSCYSRIGIGTGGFPDNSNTCGNEAVILPDNGDKHIKAIGYILIQWQEK